MLVSNELLLLHPAERSNRKTSNIFFKKGLPFFQNIVFTRFDTISLRVGNGQHKMHLKVCVSLSVYLGSSILTQNLISCLRRQRPVKTRMDMENEQLSKSRCILLRHQGLSWSPGMKPKYPSKLDWKVRLERFWCLSVT